MKIHDVSVLLTLSDKLLKRENSVLTAKWLILELPVMAIKGSGDTSFHEIQRSLRMRTTMEQPNEKGKKEKNMF